MRSLALLLTACVAISASDAVDVLKRVEKDLADKADAMKSSDLVGYSILTNAIKDLKKYTDDGDADGSRLLVQLLSPANLKKLFKSPAKVDKKTGQVWMGYDWSDPKMVQDWDLHGEQASYGKNGLLVPAAGKISHKAQWMGEVTFSGKLVLGNRNGIHLSMTNGYTAVGSNYNAWNIDLKGPGITANVAAAFSHDYTVTSDGMILPFTWKMLKDRTTLAWDKVEIGTPIPQPFLGQVTICGGEGGNSFKEIELTGMLDPNWIKQQLGLGASP